MTYHPNWITGQANGQWQYESGTSSSDPGGGKFKLDNSTPGSATNVYINDENEAGIDMGAIIGSLVSGDVVYIQEIENSRRALLCVVSGAPTDNTGWWTIPLTSADSSTAAIRTGKKCGFVMQFS